MKCGGMVDVTELLALIVDSTPFALLFAAAAFALCLIVMLIRRRRFSVLLTVCACLYLGFLLAGTLRPESMAELVEWRTPDVWNVTLQLPMGDGVSSLHGLFNMALFVPWGVLGMLIGRRPLTAIPCVLFALLMTLLIEIYQLFHLRAFDLGDVVANLLGCLLGVIIMLPHAIIRYGRK